MDRANARRVSSTRVEEAPPKGGCPERLILAPGGAMGSTNCATPKERASGVAHSRGEPLGEAGVAGQLEADVGHAVDQPGRCCAHLEARGV